MSKLNPRFTLCLVVTVSVLLAGAALGADRHSAAPPGMLQRPSSTHGPEAFGGGLYTVTSLSDLAFSPFLSSTGYSVNSEYFKYATASPADFGAGISLPAGAVIDWIGIGSCDATGGNMSLYLFQQNADTTFNLVSSIASSAHGAGAPCAVDYNALPLQYQVPGNNLTSLQLDVYQTLGSPADGSVNFGNVEIWWYTTVSPAPVSPSFLDVPPSNPFFQYIEALKLSGITGGCGDGTNFCPDQPVLRKQMATFLAKALGLAYRF